MVIQKCDTAEHRACRSAFFTLLPAIFVIILLYTGCSRSTRDAYLFSNSRKGVSRQLATSKDPIDRGITYELYFRFEKEVRCIEVNLLCSVLKNQFTMEREIINTYYVVDRVINTRSFSDARAGHVFSELGRNYDKNWNNNRITRICSSNREPIQSFVKNSVYRIRFTSFSSDVFDFRVMIKANTRVTFFETLPR